MSRKNNALSEEQQAKLIELLNRRLADAIDLHLQSRQALIRASKQTVERRGISFNACDNAP